MRRLSGYGPSLIVLFTAMLVLFLGPSAVQQLTYKQVQARMVQASRRLEQSSILEQLNQAYQDIATFVEPSVVHISAQQNERDANGFPSLASGSGWIYDEHGHIVTNYHVVRNADRIEVQLSTGDLREASIVGFDPTTDVALLQVRAGHLHPAVRADVAARPVRQGDLVFAFGSPFDFRFSMSSGVVSGKGRYVGVIGRTGYENFIQVDAAINPGNSGGPLTDYRGNVIGMNTAIATGRRPTLDEGQFAGIGLAIPLEMIEPVVEQLIAKGFVEKGYLGVEVWDVDNDYRRLFAFEGDGVRVLRVEPDGPAGLAGLQADDIVVQVNGEAVQTRRQLQSIISSFLPGESVMVDLWRPDLEAGAGLSLSAEVRLARLDPMRARGELPADQRFDRIRPLGILAMSTCTRALAAEHGAPYRPGVIVERLVPGSRLAERMQPGTIIFEVMGRPVLSVEEFIASLRDHDLRDIPGGGVRVGVVRLDGSLETLRLYAEP